MTTMVFRALVLTAALAVPAVPTAVLAQSDQAYTLPEPAAQAPERTPPAPLLGRAAVIEVVRGRIHYRLPGTRKIVRLRRPSQVPMGTVVDARNGRVRVIVARNRRGGRWRSVFYAGRFTLTQERSGDRVTTLELVGGDFSPCEPEASASRVAAEARRAKRIRRLWGDGKGRFRTRGRYSAASVRGTRWLVEDRCDGTLTRVARGIVDVEDFAVPAPSPEPAPQAPAGGGGGGGGTGGEQQDALAPMRTPESRRRIRLRRGGSYVARPGG